MYVIIWMQAWACYGQKDDECIDCGFKVIFQRPKQLEMIISNEEYEWKGTR